VEKIYPMIKKINREQFSLYVFVQAREVVPRWSVTNLNVTQTLAFVNF